MQEKCSEFWGESCVSAYYGADNDFSILSPNSKFSMTNIMDIVREFGDYQYIHLFRGMAVHMASLQLWLCRLVAVWQEWNATACSRPGQPKVILDVATMQAENSRKDKIIIDQQNRIRDLQQQKAGAMVNCVTGSVCDQDPGEGTSDEPGPVPGCRNCGSF